MLLVAALVLAINFAIVPGKGVFAAALAGLAIAATAAFVLRQRRTRFPLYDLAVAARRTFWVAALAGTIVFGTLMGAMYVGQQFMQNVLGYSTLSAGAAILPAAALMVLVAPRSARLVHTHGARFTLVLGFVVCLLGFVAMLVLWTEDIAYWKVGLAYALIGAGVGLAGTPASQSLTASVPVLRAGMASGTSDLQRDLGGAVMQSLLGAVLAAGYVRAFDRAIATSPRGDQVTEGVQAELQRSFAGATEVAERYPQYQSEILDAARSSFLSGDRWAYLAGIVAVLIGAALVWLRFPDREDESRLLASYAEQDAADEPKPGVAANTGA